MTFRYHALRSANTVAMAWVLAACSADTADSKANANAGGGETKVTSGGGGQTMASAGAGPDGTGPAAGGTGGSGGAGGTDGAANGDPSDAAVHDATADSSMSGDDLCKGGAWPTADPTQPGMFEIVSEEPVGPVAGVVEDGGITRRFRMIRPKDLGKGGLCHPVITWGNGFGDNPPTYLQLLNQLASHGFVVIASLNHYVSMGDPPPMRVGMEWVISQNADPTSPLYKHIDTKHIGATGHSAGGFATTQLGSDPRIGAIATICGTTPNPNLNGPALLMCGGMDTIATCDKMQSAFDGDTGNQPVMFAEQLAASHGSWIGSYKDPFIVADVAWMRLHLMGDTAQRSRFYGPSCTICQDAKWKVLGRKLMDQ